MKTNYLCNWANVKYPHFSTRAILYIFSIFIFILINSCKNSPADLKKYFSFLGSSGSSDNPKVFSATPANGDKNLPRSQTISILFDRPMSMNTCLQAFSISPTVRGFFTSTDTTLVFTPSSILDLGTYTYTITKFCEDKSGYDLKDVFSVNFSIGSITTAGSNPTVSSILVPSGTLAACLAGTGANTDILANTVTTGCLGNPTRSPIVFNFNQAMDTATTQNAIGFSPSLTGSYIWSNGNATLTFTPSTKLTYGATYTVLVGSTAKSANNITVVSAISSTFTAGNLITTPAVQAFGLASQGTSCGTTAPGVGNASPPASPASLTTTTCFWDDTLAMLTPSSYQFSGGDTGTGLLGSSNDCADQTSDNFRIFFNTYMDTNTTLAATSLKRLSPPLTSIALGTAAWTDCQTAAPFGCKVLTLSYAEQEASCNGNQFGTIATGGDFNLLKTTPAVANYPLYQISVSSSAKDVNGVFISPFTFSMIGQ